MSKQELTAAELEWVKNNLDTVRAMMKGGATPEAIAQVVRETDPLAVVTAQLQGNVRKKIAEIDKKLREYREKKARYESYLDGDSGDLKEMGKEYLAEMADDGFEANVAAHLEALNEKLEQLETDPEQVFLPIGTIVRIIGVPKYKDVTRLGDDRKSYPLAGSVGVVVSLHSRNDLSIGVAFRSEFKDGWGDAYCPGYDRVPTYRVEREMLEIVGYSLLPDGSEYKGYGYEQTHERKDGNEERPEMILEGAGYFWRLHDFGGTQGIELLQAQDNMEEYSWIEGPVEKYQTSPVPGM
ncbi:hypothetical protein [Mesorhizobium sp. SP-1A]|uniref:hypothetical protein n=1 Tax=Mesorhizobium sp. SP-1A TaxID=3077840 RepID=UPI0028F7423D|nr:hypothetical protein [Mesorhizobium sp. SP-1A]